MLLSQLDAEVAAIGNATIVTCVYAVLDPHAGTLTYGTAGHVPPLLSAPGQPTRTLGVGDPPLGSGSYHGAVETVPWQPGSRLTLYTDGLVERRGTDLDAAIARLCRLLDGADRAVEEVPGRPSDDVAMLSVAARRPGTSALAVPVPHADTGARDARRASASALSEWGVRGNIASDVALIISELVTNALRHGNAPIQLRLRHEKVDHQRIVVDVADGGLLQPNLREMDPASPTGRGLHLVSALSRAWGVRPTGNGKSVWCVIDL
jgi:anti-sigma regulatory factor (Ser/Thr protein kinase)